ncbi:MAG: hypothetical protein JXA20_11055 [Spirochaetes bacterium]|nr:hypothetical protein [Spirochaetota bacterium]
MSFLLFRKTGAAVSAALVSLAAVALGACGNGSPSPASSEPVLVLAAGRDFFDGPESETCIHGSANVWEALVKMDGRLRPRPWLAERWESRGGGKIWRFRLRGGVLFHNGAPLTAADVVANMERKRRHPRFDPRGIMGNVTALRAAGDRVVEFRLLHPLPFFPGLLSYYGSPILHPSSFNGDGTIRRMIGTGPFMFRSVDRGRSLTLVRFDRYWGARPAYGRVVFKVIHDANIRIQSLRKGEIDGIADIGGILPDQARDLGRDRGIVLKRQMLGSTHYLVFNCGAPPFDDRDARLWLVRQLDWKESLEAITEGGAVVDNLLITPLAGRWDTGGGVPERIVQRPAFSAGRGPLRILLHRGFFQRLPYLPIAEMLVDLLDRQGVRAEISIQEAGAYGQMLKAGDFHLSIQPSNLLTGDPDIFFSGTGVKRAAGYNSPALTLLVEEARHEMNESRRRELYRRAARIVWSDLPIFPLYHEEALYAHRDSVQYLAMDPLFRPDLLTAKPRPGKTLKKSAFVSLKKVRSP